MGFAPPFAKYIDLDQISIYEEMFVYHVSFSFYEPRRMSNLIKSIVIWNLHRSKQIMFEMFIIETNSFTN